MTDTNEEATDNSTEEVEINLSYVNGDNESEQSDTKSTPTPTETPTNASSETHKHVECKPINELTDEERRIIIENARVGYDQPNYSVTFFKNGKTRIVKKKPKKHTLSERVIQSAPPTKANENKVYYSDNQLMMEHIMDLSSKVDRLMAKHKKLKKKYYNLRDDIYVDNDDEDTDTANDNVHTEPTKSSPPIDANPSPTIEPEPEQYQQPIPQPKPILRASWRSMVNYL